MKNFDYNNLNAISRWIMLFIDYASTGETLRYLKTLKKEQLEDWKLNFAKLKLTDSNSVYKTIQNFLS